MLPSGAAMKPKSPERAVHRLQGSRPKTTGQALVEFGVVVPVMVLILLIAVDFQAGSSFSCPGEQRGPRSRLFRRF